MQSPFIKKFTIDNDFYIYDVGSNKFFKVDEPVYHLIDKNSSSSNDDVKLSDRFSEEVVTEAQSTIDHMKEKGHFSSHKPTINSFHTGSRDDFINYQRDILDNRLRRVTLVVTEACNQRCRYCAYSGKYKYNRRHSEKNMSSAVMRKAADFYFAHSGDNEEKNISFYGGEPLVNFKLIKECVEYAKSKHCKDTEFNMTINGTLLDKEKAEFLVSHNFSLLISLDGPKEIHDRYRVFKNGKGTFDRLYQNLKDLKRRYPDYYKKKIRFNMVTAPPIELEKINEFIKNSDLKAARFKFSSVNIKFSSFYKEFSQAEWDDYWGKRGKVLNSFHTKLASGEALDELESSMFAQRFLRIHRREIRPLPSKYPSHGQCPLGERSLLVNTDGSFNFCTKMDDTFNLGDVDSGYDFSELMNIYDSFSKLLEEHCYGCWAIRLCHKCINDVSKNGIVDANMLQNLCTKRKNSILKEIKDYIQIREQREEAFDYLDDVVIT